MMSPISPITWLSRAEIVALGWTLLHFCWQGTAVAVAFGAVDRLTSHATSKVRYTIALAALMIMPAIVVGTFALELHVATPTHTPAGDTTVISTPLHTRSNPSCMSCPSPPASKNQHRLARHTHRSPPPLGRRHLVPRRALPRPSLHRRLVAPREVRRHAQRMIPQELEQAFLRLCEQIEVGRKVVLRASDEVISPMAMGIWRATVILPISAVLSLPKEELQAVIAHELGHIRRWDYLWNLLQTAIESLLFFHPAVWWISRTVRDRREICCDEIAVRSCSDAAIYARALLRLEEQRTVKLRLAMALGGCGGSLLARVRKILGEDMAMEGNMTSGVSVAAIGALVLTLLLGPKISEAVTTPAGSHQMLEQVVAISHPAIVSQITGPKAPLVVPDGVTPLVVPDGVAPLVVPDGVAPQVVPDAVASPAPLSAEETEGRAEAHTGRAHTASSDSASPRNPSLRQHGQPLRHRTDDASGRQPPHLPQTQPPIFRACVKQATHSISTTTSTPSSPSNPSESLPNTRNPWPQPDSASQTSMNSSH